MSSTPTPDQQEYDERIDKLDREIKKQHVLVPTLDADVKLHVSLSEAPRGRGVLATIPSRYACGTLFIHHVLSSWRG